MNCANHSDTAAVAFCRICGKPLCANCTRDVRGVIYCESCLAARMEGASPAAGFVPPVTPNPPSSTFAPGAATAPPGYQQVVQPVVPLRVASSSSGPNPTVAGILAGFFPFGVGAVYCSQYAKGLAHLVIFVLMIVGLSSNLPWFVDTVLGISLSFFYIYQIIDAIRTAKALQAGQPAPDPMGLAQTFGMGEKFDSGKVPVGAVVLIGMGVLFLLHTMGIMEYGFERYWPLIIILLGAWMFYRHWERSSQRCPCGRCSTRWLMGPVVILTTGVLLLLQSLDIADLGRTWPAWLLIIGVVKLLQSTASSEGHIGPLPPGPMPPGSSASGAMPQGPAPGSPTPASSVTGFGPSAGTVVAQDPITPSQSSSGTSGEVNHV